LSDVGGNPLPGFRAVVRRVLATELLCLVRDRRALFSALVLPMMLYPLLFIGQGWLDEVSRETLESRTVSVTYDLTAAEPALAERVLTALAQELPIELAEVDAASIAALTGGIEAGTVESMRAERHAALHLLEQQGDVLLVALAGDDVPPLRLRAYYDGTADVANEARKRVVHALDGLSDAIEHERLVELVGADPAHGIDPDVVDLASEQDTSGAFLGRFLPLVASLDFGRAHLLGDVGEAIETVGGHLWTTHIHDNGGKKNDHLVPYSGTIHWDEAMMETQKVGYDGALIFELSAPAGGDPVEVLTRAAKARERLEKTLIVF
jgi:hypothetical protein